ncbi:uncharacterized protein LOC105392153 [Plutella xylostella]|uniref:uncharacterized protein LOC105392153 n=1 Tax=Plutella xylostella TaxID=51655 RepID=UPI002032FC48|nr:uncharacterized protein LOC105392153 [Plutella xylostella]XP_048482896.1 uncharacterized protein LOC105392153 [Plutella xylostella]
MNQWRNKHEVLRDLAEVSDYGPRCTLNLNPVTDKPHIYATEDTDLNEIADYYGFPKNTSSERYVKPNLRCITQMIDMVREEGDLPDYSCDRRSRPQQPTQIVEISKLNPNVTEFVPKVASNSTDSDNSNASTPSCSNAKTDVLVPKENVDLAKNTDAVHNEAEKVKTLDLDINKRIDVSTLDPTEAEVLAEKIKSQIDKIPAAASFESRFLKNAALSSLMKVYSVAAPPPAESCTKLLTPDYFMKANDADNTVSKETKESATDFEKATECDITVDEIKASIQKVKNWQDSITEIEIAKDVEIPAKEVIQTPPKVFKPVVQLAPPTYRRKEKATKSPQTTLQTTSSSGTTSRSSVYSQPAVSPVLPKTYVPSQKATELYEKFSKNAEMAQKPKVGSMWDQLEKQLKEKDAALKKKQMQSSE